MENPQNQHPRIVPPNPPRDTNLEEFNDEFKYANASEGNELVVDGIDYDADGIIDDFDIFDEY
mgnify:CR=1 FL=1